MVGDELRTDVAAIAANIKRLGPERVACVVTTTSCFAPRGADSIVDVVRWGDILKPYALMLEPLNPRT